MKPVDATTPGSMFVAKCGREGDPTGTVKARFFSGGEEFVNEDVDEEVDEVGITLFRPAAAAAASRWAGGRVKTPNAKGAVGPLHTLAACSRP